jgi:hypothetical protein
VEVQEDGSVWVNFLSDRDLPADALRKADKVARALLVRQQGDTVLYDESHLGLLYRGYGIGYDLCFGLAVRSFIADLLGWIEIGVSHEILNGLLIRASPHGNMVTNFSAAVG